RRFFDGLKPTDYLAIMAYVERTPEAQAALDEIRRAVRAHYGVATTSGYGPRFLHSTGQFHKGGPPSGHFLQITAEPALDLPIPGEVYTFGTLIRAQALGDLEALARRNYPVLRLHVTGDVGRGLQTIAQAARQAAGE
ncbi:MAG TPA: transaldolase, partial [Chloroflexi bacterium]|nr:transaldolase [Chloroflexota bacterium]